MYYAVDYYADMGQISQDCFAATQTGASDFDMDELDDLDQVTQVIGYHPQFHDHFLATQNFIMKGDGPLPNDYRYYLAIIAAARHQCPYLVKRYEKEFINQGGDSAWLGGLDFIPAKLRAIYDINKILAHRPWLLRKEHIERLTKGKNSWSLSEVVHAMVLLSHFHSLSSFVFSCGLTQKLDGLSSPKLKSPPAAVGALAPTILITPTSPTETQKGKPVLAEISLNNANPDYNSQTAASSNGGAPPDSANAAADGPDATALNGYLATAQQLPQQHGISVEALMERMKVLSQKQDECSEAELSSRFQKVEQQTAELAAVTPEAAVGVPTNLSHYVDDANFIYQDFARRGTESINTFRIQDYSWEDHGYSLVDGLYNDVGIFLDAKFRAAYNLTYCTMGGIKNVDTSKFRRAIWNYIQCIYGIRHDDYDYGEVNQLLVRPLKMFIKTACCFPERITTKDYDSVLVELQDSEKVHVNLMIMEARNQAELLYALREIMRYMT
ncbi:sestrin homolog [Drosophila mauritiana]|uniref:Sestrin homolog n=1 Tax=Drosophila mauritiana TaxID=7226 RepID=A0A6P8JBB9_DROMA|nr:sestrin homolog [Drosophila mauritiana]XP_033153218.1 sestrin homolog [Drosophila mauritiana]